MISVNPAINSGTAIAGNTLTFKGTVKNQGNATAGGTFSNRFEVDLGNNGSVDTTLSPHPSLTALAASAEQQVVSGNWTAVAGTHRVILCADQPNPSVAESDETNNCNPAGTGVITIATDGNQPPNSPGGGGSSGGGISTPPAAGLNTTNSGTAAFGENPPGACTAPRQPTLAWTFSDPDGDTQGAYQIQIDDNSNFASPVLDTGKVFSTTNAYIVPAGRLSFATTYYWRVRVWDSRDAVSGWTDGQTFSTQTGDAPSSDYSWSPSNPNVNQNTDFRPVSLGSAYTYAWTFQDGNPPSATVEQPRVKFSSSGDKSTSLIVKDSVNLSCGQQKVVPVGGTGGALPPPTWQEIPPQ